MSHARWIAVAAGALLAAACSQTKPVESEKKQAAEAHETELPVQEVAAELKTPLVGAITAALAKSPGEAIEAGIEGDVENGKRDVFVEVMVLDAHGDAIEVKVDPASGKVLSAAKETEADEAAELAGVAKKLPSGHLSLADLVQRASSGAEGQMVAAGFALSKEHGAVGVVRFLVGKELHQVTLDPKTAAVLAKKTIEQEEEDEGDEGDEKDEAKEKK